MEGNLVELVNGGVLLAKEERTKEKKMERKRMGVFGRERGWGNKNEMLANGRGEAMKKEIRDIMC